MLKVWTPDDETPRNTWRKDPNGRWLYYESDGSIRKAFSPDDHIFTWPRCSGKSYFFGTPRHSKHWATHGDDRVRDKLVNEFDTKFGRGSMLAGMTSAIAEAYQVPAGLMFPKSLLRPAEVIHVTERPICVPVSKDLLRINGPDVVRQAQEIAMGKIQRDLERQLIGERVTPQTESMIAAITKKALGEMELSVFKDEISVDLDPSRGTVDIKFNVQLASRMEKMISMDWSVPTVDVSIHPNTIAVMPDKPGQHGDALEPKGYVMHSPSRADVPVEPWFCDDVIVPVQHTAVTKVRRDMLEVNRDLPEGYLEELKKLPKRMMPVSFRDHEFLLSGETNADGSFVVPPDVAGEIRRGFNSDFSIGYAPQEADRAKRKLITEYTLTHNEARKLKGLEPYREHRMPEMIFGTFDAYKNGILFPDTSPPPTALTVEKLHEAIRICRTVTHPRKREPMKNSTIEIPYDRSDPSKAILLDCPTDGEVVHVSGNGSAATLHILTEDKPGKAKKATVFFVVPLGTDIPGFNNQSDRNRHHGENVAVEGIENVTARRVGKFTHADETFFVYERTSSF